MNQKEQFINSINGLSDEVVKKFIEDLSNLPNDKLSNITIIEITIGGMTDDFEDLLVASGEIYL